MTVIQHTNYIGFEKAMHTWLLVHADVADVQQADLELGRPAVPYATLTTINPGMLEGQDAEFLKFDAATDNLKLLLHGPRRMSVQVTVYTAPGAVAGANHASNRLMKAVDALRSPTVRNALALEGLTFLQVLSPPTRLDEQLGERWEWRAQADLEFLYTALLEDSSAVAADKDYGYIKTNDDPAVIVTVSNDFGT